MKKGILLAQGSGVFNMMDVSAKKGFNKENSILEVLDETDISSPWKIYKKG